MILNDILTKQEFLNSIILGDGSNELSKELKVKIVRLRMALNKIKKKVDSEIQEYANSAVPEEFKKAQPVPFDQLPAEEQDRIKAVMDQVNADYKVFLEKKLDEDVEIDFDDSFTESEFDEIIGLNAGREVVFNDVKIAGEELLETFHELFVK